MECYDKFNCDQEDMTSRPGMQVSDTHELLELDKNLKLLLQGDPKQTVIFDQNTDLVNPIWTN